MKTQSTFILVVFLLSIFSCKKESYTIEQIHSNQLTASSSDEIFRIVRNKYQLPIKASDFVMVIDNPYFSLKPGTIYHYINAILEDGLISKEIITVTVTYDLKVILGVNCIVVHDQVTVDEEITEDTYDWYAQDRWGNVWYFGEDTKSYDDGDIDSSGSFEAGVDGALPGIIMLANPGKHIGLQYYQEHYPGEAVDQATVVSVNGTAGVVYGTFNNCVVTEEHTVLEPGVLENKYYAPGVGQVLTVLNVGGWEREELINITYY